MINIHCRTKHQLSPSDEEFFFGQAPITNKSASHNPVKHQINKILRPLPSLTPTYTHPHTLSLTPTPTYTHSHTHLHSVTHNLFHFIS